MWAAVVGLGRPEVFPDGAATGTSAASRMARHTGWEGQRIPTVSSPAVTTSGTMGFRRKIMVRVPASRPPPKRRRCPEFLAVPLQVVRRGDVQDQGVVLGPALGLKDMGHRVRSRPLAPRPYTVSVGMPTSPPARRIAAARSTSRAVSASVFTLLPPPK